MPPTPPMPPMPPMPPALEVDELEDGPGPLPHWPAQSAQSPRQSIVSVQSGQVQPSSIPQAFGSSSSSMQPCVRGAQPATFNQQSSQLQSSTPPPFSGS